MCPNTPYDVRRRLTSVDVLLDPSLSVFRAGFSDH